MAPRTFAEEPPQQRRRHTRVARKALGGFTGLLADTVDLASVAARPGYLQSLDARAKVLGMLGLVVVATIVHSALALALAYAVCWALAKASRIPNARLLRVWLAVPLFTLVFVLPATLNVVSPGQVLFVVWRHPMVGVTAPGLVVAARMVLRTATCVSLALLLASTTPAPKLFRGLRSLGVPVMFIALLTMMERYLDVVLRAANEVQLAKTSRTISGGSLSTEHAWVAAGLGSVYRRSQAIGRDVYHAMVSRGFDGEPRSVALQRWSYGEWMALVGALALGSTMLVIG